MSTISINTKDGNSYCNFIEDYFYSLPSQGNIYTLAPLRNHNGVCKFLVATLQKKIFCLEYSSSGSYSFIEIPLSSIPIGADIISMNAVPSSKENFFNIGASFCKKEGVEVVENYLNIYSNLDVPGFKEADTPINCCSVSLQYMPYHLYYTYTASDVNQTSPLWVLCGSDCAVHMYKSTASNQYSYEEVSCVENGFPEFTEASDVTVRLDVYYAHDTKSRITAMCGDKGNISIFFTDISDANTPIVKNKRKLSFDFPTSCAKFFKLYSYASFMFPFVEGHKKEVDESREECDNNSIYTVLATTLEACFIHRDIEHDLSGYQLPQSENYDVVTSCLVCDVDFDGINEVLLGTYGQTVLIYHQADEEDHRWVLSKTLPFSSPVLSLAYEDFLGDGVSELIVHTMAGVHIYQHDPEETSSLLLERLRIMVKQKQAQGIYP